MATKRLKTKTAAKPAPAPPPQPDTEPEGPEPVWVPHWVEREHEQFTPEGPEDWAPEPEPPPLDLPPMKGPENLWGALAAQLERLKARALETEPEPLACPYARCENIFVIEQGRSIAKPLGWVPPDETGRARRCQCAIDRSQRGGGGRKLFTIVDVEPEPEGEL